MLSLARLNYTIAGSVLHMAACVITLQIMIILDPIPYDVRINVLCWDVTLQTNTAYLVGLPFNGLSVTSQDQPTR